MKQFILLFTLSIFTLDTQAQETSPIKYYELEPSKPFFYYIGTFPKSSINYVNGRVVIQEESKEEFRKRDQQEYKKEYSEYIQSKEYQSWLKEHIEWRKRNPNWKEITRYTELLTAAEIVARNKPKPIKGESYNVTSKTLNLRKSPDKNATILKTLSKGSSVVLIESIDSNWWFVQIDSLKGFVFFQYLKLDPYSGWEPIKHQSGDQPACINVTPLYNYEIDNYLKIKMGPGTDAVVKLMKNDLTVPVCIRMAYVRGSDSFKMKNIPEGQYFLKIAYGNDFRQKIINNKCEVKFMNNAIYKKGDQILDFVRIKQPDRIIAGKVYESYNVQSYELKLGVVVSKNMNDKFESNNISEFDFNR